MDFNEFLDTKKIDYHDLKLHNLKLYDTLEYQYYCLGKTNLDFNKKYLFNKLRLLHPIKIDK